MSEWQKATASAVCQLRVEREKKKTPSAAALEKVKGQSLRVAGRPRGNRAGCLHPAMNTGRGYDLLVFHARLGRPPLLHLPRCVAAALSCLDFARRMTVINTSCCQTEEWSWCVRVFVCSAASPPNEKQQQVGGKCSFNQLLFFFLSLHTSQASGTSPTS